MEVFVTKINAASDRFDKFLPNLSKSAVKFVTKITFYIRSNNDYLIIDKASPTKTIDELSALYSLTCIHVMIIYQHSN